MSYSGAHDLRELRTKAEFMRITSAGNKESLSLLLLAAGVRELRWGTHAGLMSAFRESWERIPDSPHEEFLVAIA